MKSKKLRLMGITAALVLLVIDFVFFTGQRIFPFMLGIGFLLASAPFIFELLTEGRKEQEINTKFLEFTRNLAESVTTGTPISKSIVNMAKKDYGALNLHVQKMSNQINLGIPVSIALQTFADDIDNRTIRRAVSLIMQAEKAGGEIDYILSSVANSISETEKLKEERRAVIFNLVLQGYIIFFIFIGIMLVMEFKILPLTIGISNLGVSSALTQTGLGIGTGAEETLSPEQISQMFLYLLMTQGFFAGLTIGKLSEGTLKAGIKHSFIMTIAAYLISTGVRALLL